MVRDQLVATVFCFGASEDEHRSSADTLDWREVAAGAAHVAVSLHWAQHAQATQTSSTARKLLVHALAAANAAGVGLQGEKCGVDSIEHPDQELLSSGVRGNVFISPFAPAEHPGR
jgi:hypothetical protein